MPGKNSASFESDGITPGSILIFLSPRWFVTRPCARSRP